MIPFTWCVLYNGYENLFIYGICNKWDDPALVIPYNMLDNVVKLGQKHQQRGRPHNFSSEWPSDLMVQDHSARKTQVWEYITQPYPTDSPARQVDQREIHGPMIFPFTVTYLPFTTRMGRPMCHGFGYLSSIIPLFISPLFY